MAERILAEEGLGVTIRSVEFRDVEVSGDVLSFRCPLRSRLETEAGRHEARINVYVVFSVDGSDSRGQACEIGGSFVALAHEAGPTLLAHELGHNLSLIHVDSDTEHFDRRNVMHSASDTRHDLTEGQVVRAQLKQASVLNALLGSRTPHVQRHCYGGVSARCPPTGRPAAAFDEEAAADDATTRLRGMWSERAEELTRRR